MVSEKNRLIAQYLADVFSGRPNAQRYWDEDEKSSIDIMRCDIESEGITAYATLGLSDYEINDEEGKPRSFGVEIVGICDATVLEFPNLLSSCAFNVINDKMQITPYTIYPSVFSYYPNLSTTLEHVFLIPPMIWDNLETKTFAGREVAFLQAIGITNQEYEYAVERGTDALEDRFEEAQIDIFDINRKSVV